MHTFNCPRCHSLVSLNELSLLAYGSSIHSRKTNYGYQSLYKCNNPICSSFIIQETDGSNTIYHPIKSQDFDLSQYANVKGISPNFIEYYNNSWHVEQLGYKDISGPGYRKALEYLLKDYVLTLTNLTDNQKSSIPTMKLQQCINDFIEDDELKQISTRAYWLGNDQTHYYTKRNNKDIDDLKELIELTLHLIEKKLKSARLISEMPS